MPLDVVNELHKMNTDESDPSTATPAEDLTAISENAAQSAGKRQKTAEAVLSPLRDTKKSVVTVETEVAVAAGAAAAAAAEDVQMASVSDDVAVAATSAATHKAFSQITQLPVEVQSESTAAAEAPPPPPVNDAIPLTGKPLAIALNNKLSQASARSPRQRKSKSKAPMYESEISDNKMGIKLCIKKSDGMAATLPSGTMLPIALGSPKTTNVKRKRSRKSKVHNLDGDEEDDYRPQKKRDSAKKGSFSNASSHKDQAEPLEQSVWGGSLPEDILREIFAMVVASEGTLPTLPRLGSVCSLWRRASLSLTLWRHLNLSQGIKSKYCTEIKLKWFLENRCSFCVDLNLANYKITNTECVLEKVAKCCPKLQGISLSGWKNLTSDHLAYLVDNVEKLARIDLSSVNMENNASKSAVGLASLCNNLEKMGPRLTHLNLGHNRLGGIPQIINTLSAHCPNLELLDLSNISTIANSHAVLNIEKLQIGCQKLKVLRLANSNITLSSATMEEMMNSPGFPELEELSVAALEESRIMGDEHLQRILKNSTKLKLLDVRNCSRLTHESLIRLQAWDLKHLFLSFCSITRDFSSSGLELIASKWAHSLIELDLAWANVQQPLDNALRILSESGADSPLAHLNLCGSSVSVEAVKEILANCVHLSFINLSSCRGLPRGVKRPTQGVQELKELREALKVQLKCKVNDEKKQEPSTAAARACEKVDNGVLVSGSNTVTRNFD